MVSILDLWTSFQVKKLQYLTLSLKKLSMWSNYARIPNVYLQYICWPMTEWTIDTLEGQAPFNDVIIFEVILTIVPMSIFYIPYNKVYNIWMVRLFLQWKGWLLRSSLTINFFIKILRIKLWGKWENKLHYIHLYLIQYGSF